MKYSTWNLYGPGIQLPLPFPIKLLVTYKPPGGPIEAAVMVTSADPEAAADAIVREYGWDRRPDFRPADVWVDGGL